MHAKKFYGFTLIELVIVVAIIGILALMIVPQFHRVVDQAKLRLFENNCKTVISAITVYQAGHDGDMPADDAELATVLNGGLDAITGKPSGASYTYAGGVFKALYTDHDGVTHDYQYPL